MATPASSICVDLVLIGGGVAGLWLANRARQAGFSVLLFEQRALGSEQTFASQGMIHGGMKYTLTGALTGASEAIAEMPRHWRDCLCGDGDVDLRHTRILSDHFFMWSSETVASRVTSFLASKLTRGRVEAVHPDRRPPLLRTSEFSGSLYKLEDLVIDVPSLVANLANNIEGCCYLIDWQAAELQRDTQEQISLTLNQGDQPLTINAKQFIFTAGKGNAQLLDQLGLSAPAMQIRPLQQVMVKHSYGFDFYGHCLGAETSPRLTISSHRLPHGEHIWYLGGSLAEKGATMAAEDLIELAKAELAELIPWVNLASADWATLPVVRAEPRQPGLVRPDKAFVAAAAGAANLLVGWPTKLTLAPNFANQTLELLRERGLTPGASPQPRLDLPLAPIARTPWDLAFPPPISEEERIAKLFPAADDEESE